MNAEVSHLLFYSVIPGKTYYTTHSMHAYNRVELSSYFTISNFFSFSLPFSVFAHHQILF